MAACNVHHSFQTNRSKGEMEKSLRMFSTHIDNSIIFGLVDRLICLDYTICEFLFYFEDSDVTKLFNSVLFVGLALQNPL